MDYFKFIVKKEDQSFVAIVKNNSDQFTAADLDKYSTLITDEQTARANFTMTGHLPSDKFEELLAQAKGDDAPLGN